MRRHAVAASIAIPLLLAGLSACGDPKKAEKAQKPDLRTVPAADLRLVGDPGPDSRELTIRYTADALLWQDQPIAHVEAEQSVSGVFVTVRILIYERVPGPDEAVPNYATLRTVTVKLGKPLGRATVLDGSATPPKPIPPAEPAPGPS
jgi:hypothetical protein